MNANAHFLNAAYNAAQQSLAEGGIPIGGALVMDENVIATGYNRRVQDGSATRHAETDCLENAGRLAPAQYRKATMVTTLSPCAMCSGSIILYGIPHVVIGENQNFTGEEDWLRSRGVRVDVVDDASCIAMMGAFIADNRQVWGEDIGTDL